MRTKLIATIRSAVADRERLRQCLYLALILIGIGLRTWQFLADTSLYIDEIAVAHDVVRTAAVDLLLHRLPEQIAPKGFLLATKASISVFGPTDMALRLVAFVCSLISVVAFWRLAMRLPGWAGPLALALFDTALPLILFGSEVKQYSSDVLAALLLMLMTLRLAEQKQVPFKQLWLFATAGAALVWFSQAAVLVVAAQIAVLLWLWRGQPGRIADSVTVFVAWILSASAAAFVSAESVGPDVRPYLKQYWAAGFMPLSLDSFATTLWPWDRFMSLLGAGGPASLGLPLPALSFALVVLGFVVLWRRESLFAACLLAPIAASMAAAILQQYPFSDRLVLFLMPALLLALAVGVDAARRFASRFFRPLGLATFALLAGTFLSPCISTPPPYHTEDMKLVLEYLRARRRPGDPVYAYYAAAPATAWYGTRYGLGKNEYSVGGCHRGYPEMYFRELDEFRGSPRLWVLITHARADLEEREEILNYLDDIGTRSEQIVVDAHMPDGNQFPAAAYLYDLSKAPAISVNPENDVERPTLSCLHGPQVMIRKHGVR